MVYKTVKNSISNYPNPQINCTVQCYLKQEDIADDTRIVYWIPFSVSLVDCMEKKMTQEQIDDYIQQQGTQLYNTPDIQVKLQAIEYGAALGI